MLLFEFEIKFPKFFDFEIVNPNIKFREIFFQGGYLLGLSQEKERSCLKAIFCYHFSGNIGSLRNSGSKLCVAPTKEQESSEYGTIAFTSECMSKEGVFEFTSEGYIREKVSYT